MTGNCYVASEAAYHLLGGKAEGWVPMRVNHENSVHWYLENRITNQRIDLTASQFKTPIPYEKAVGCGFLTKQPSKRAAALMKSLVWQT